MAYKRTGGQILVESLLAHTVKHVFGVPTVPFLPVLDALYDVAPALTFIPCRHEQGAALMAEATGKLTGEPGVCLVTHDPGACSATLAAHTAARDGSPLIVLAGQSSKPSPYPGGLQDLDWTALFAPIAKHVELVQATAELSETLARSFHRARSGRPGPVVLCLPEEVLASRATVEPVGPISDDPVVPADDILMRGRDALAAAERPMMIVGGSGWTQGAKSNIQTYASENNLPVCCTFQRLDIIDNDHYNFCGELGLDANPALIERVRSADCLIIVGPTYGELILNTSHAQQTRPTAVVHAASDLSQETCFPGASEVIDVNVAAFAEAMRRLAPVDGTRWRSWAAEARWDYLDDTRPMPPASGLDMSAVMMTLQDLLGEDAVVTVDTGGSSGWPHRLLRFGGDRRLLGPTNDAPGYGVPAAIAAKLASPDSTVIACVGDGGFAASGHELGTACQIKANTIVMVFNNGSHGSIRKRQEELYGERSIATDLTNPDFRILAQAYGAHSETITKATDLAPAFQRALTSGLPTILDLQMEPSAPSARADLSALRRMPWWDEAQTSRGSQKI